MESKKLIELDFLMIYEHKVRELENLCLLKYELEKRGYKVKILHIEDSEAARAVKPIYYAKVVVLMACYRNSTLEWHTKDYVKFDKVIDMQWENIVYPKDEKAADVFKNYSGIGKEVVRVSWGDANRRRLLEAAHMEPSKIKLIGHVGMDFLREELKGYYISKEELFKEYNIPSDKKTLLFASPFYSDNLSESYITDMCSRFGKSWRDYYSFMMESEKTILEWMARLCEARKDIIVIFRPHPGHIGKRIAQAAKEHSNFRIISDKSIKQWILTCDKVYTGNSSTFVEAYFAKKQCFLLFPYEVTDGFELNIIKDAKKICCYEDFYRSIDNNHAEFPVSEAAINDVYTIDWQVPGYIKFADMAEEVLHNSFYNLTKQQLKSYRTKQPLSILIQKKISRCDWLYQIYLKLIENETIHVRWLDEQRMKRNHIDEIAERLEKESTSEEEINNIIEKIKNQLDQ